MSRLPSRVDAGRCLLAAIILAWGMPARGAATCTVSALPVAFGVYDSLNGLASTSTGKVTVTCQPVLVSVMQSFTLSLSTGGAGSFSPRRLSSGAHTLQYQLFSDAAHTMVWGDGSGGSATVGGGFVLSVLLPVSAANIVYARLPASQTGVTAGSYADTIIVTVTY